MYRSGGGAGAAESSGGAKCQPRSGSPERHAVTQFFVRESAFHIGLAGAPWYLAGKVSARQGG